MNDEQTIVLKFGSSVLRDEPSLPIAVAEIYQELRRGRRVLAVVSALAGTTDRLLAEARRIAGEPQPAALAGLLATGERGVAALLALFLDRAGIPATLLDPLQVGPFTRGPLLDAQPVGLDTQAIERALSRRPVAVLPGFIGIDEEGEPSLLGRGGSDLSALFVAQRLGASTCRLLKDTGGLYEHDPARPGPAPRRFERITWDRALQLDPRIIQPKGVRFARDQRLVFEVAAPGGRDGTTVGAGQTALAPAAQARPLRVALLGLGTVGLGVYRQLATRPEQFEVTAVAVREPAKHRDDGLPRGLLLADPWQAVERPHDVLVELIGGREPAADLIEAALAAGKDVVTANKELIALFGPRFELQAACGGGRIRYSAAVGGGLPAIETVERLAAAGPIRAIRGVLNGTTNFLLDRWAAGADPEAALAEAQARGFAEADPTLDTNGFDAACKLAILARAAFEQPIDAAAVARRGIDQLEPAAVLAARRAGRVVRLVASARATAEGPVCRVAPAELPLDHPLAAARGEENILVVEPVSGPPVVLRGKGAGRWPTSQSVLADLLDLARSRRTSSLTHTLAAAV